MASIQSQPSVKSRKASRLQHRSDRPGQERDSTQEMATRFMYALRICEKEGDTKPLVDLFSERALISHCFFLHPYYGKAGAERFWSEYLRTFNEVESQFVHVNGGNSIVVLEWTSDGLLRNGKPFSYKGVSLIEFEDDEITRFQAYYTRPAGSPET